MHDFVGKTLQSFRCGHVILHEELHWGIYAYPLKTCTACSKRSCITACLRKGPPDSYEVR